MVTTTSGASAPGSVEALKRVKATETEWDTRLASARRETEEALRRLRDESDAAVKAAQADAEGDRAARLEHARADTESEAAKIVADGRAAAEKAAVGEGRRPAEKKDAILDVVLGTFGGD